MSINFTLSDEQKKLQHEVRSFAENVLAPVVAEADREPDPVKAVQRTKPAYVQAYKAGIAMCMLAACQNNTAGKPGYVPPSCSAPGSSCDSGR